MGRNDCMTLDEAIQEFEFDCKIRHLSPKTIDNYKKQLRYFERFHLYPSVPSSSDQNKSFNRLPIKTAGIVFTGKRALTIPWTVKDHHLQFRQVFKKAKCSR